MAPRGRGGTGKYERSVEDAKIDADAADLRYLGMTYQQIADEQGGSKSTAFERVHRAVAAVPVEAVEKLRTIECARYDAELRRLADLDVIAFEVMRREHLVVSEGRIIRTDGREGDPLHDSKPVYDALNILRQNGLARIKVSEARRKLMGLDVPVRTEVNVTNDGSDLATEFAAFLAGVDTATRAGASEAAGLATDSTT